jgi:hypothetical protein
MTTTSNRGGTEQETFTSSKSGAGSGSGQQSPQQQSSQQQQQSSYQSSQQSSRQSSRQSSWPSSGTRQTATRRPLSASSKFSSADAASPEEALQQELDDDRVSQYRADSAMDFVSDLEISTRGSEGIHLPNRQILTRSLVRESGIAAFDDEDDPFGDLPDDVPQPPSGAVIGETVAAFTDGLTGQQKDDVEDAVLLSQLAAELKYSPKDQPVEYFDYFRKVLQRVGYILGEGRWSRLTSSRSSFTVDSAIINVIRSMLTQNQLATAEAALDAMKSLEDRDRRIVIWEKSSLDGPSDGAFTMDVAGRSPQGTVSIKSSAYAFGTNTQVTRFLWFSFPSSQTRFAASRATLVLNQRVYDQVRDAVTQKLGNSAVSFVGTLPDFSSEIPG